MNFDLFKSVFFLFLNKNICSISLSTQVRELGNTAMSECLVHCVHDGTLYHVSTKLVNNFLAAYPEFATNFARNVEHGT